jgi:ATP-dependent Clp protease ATP-binding subunit ClpX
MASLESPKDLFDKLNADVVDQQTALQQISVALFKHLRQVRVGNIMLVGNSGTGKTTIMRAVERLFREDPDLVNHSNTIRMNANVVAEDVSSNAQISIILETLRQNALRIMGDDRSVERFRALMEQGVVFLDEVDKIRSHVGDSPNPQGILAQEAILTLIEGEKVDFPFAEKRSDGTLEEHMITIDTGRVLFVCGGAFEGLYDMVYRRVASGETKDRLVQEFVVEDHNDELDERTHFSLQDFVRYEDMFEYGMTPQFLGRFDEIIILNELTVKGLMRIFVEPKDSLYREARRYFGGMGIELQITKEGLRALAEQAYDHGRIGARALRMIFKRVMRGIEFDPLSSPYVQEREGRKLLRVTRDMVDRMG